MAFSRSKPPAIDDSEPLAAGVAARPGDPDRDIIHLVKTGDCRAAYR